MQYAIRAYLTSLLKNGRYEKPLEKDEIVFFKAFEKVIDGKKLSTSDKAKIRDYIMEKHGREIKKLRECKYAPVLEELQKKPVAQAAGVQIWFLCFQQERSRTFGHRLANKRATLWGGSLIWYWSLLNEKAAVQSVRLQNTGPGQ